MLSRWPIAILPQSLYVMDDTGTVNLTIAAATYEIMLSFNKLSTDGIKLREFRSRGAHEVPLLIKFGNLFRYPKFGKVYWESLFQTCFLNHTCWTAAPRLPSFVSTLWDFVEIGKHSNRYSISPDTTM